jgi:nitronate monooxygenase
MALWAGQGHRLARDLPTARLIELLVSELDAARGAMAARTGSGNSL